MRIRASGLREFGFRSEGLPGHSNALPCRVYWLLLVQMINVRETSYRGLKKWQITTPTSSTLSVYYNTLQPRGKIAHVQVKVGLGPG